LSWSMQKVPPAGSFLTGVSCTARTLCTAVGQGYTAPPYLYTYPIALRWTGRGWSLSQSPYQGAQINAVSCWSATACTWVGEYDAGSGPGYLLVGRWDGMRWTQGRNISYPSVDFSTALSAVSCTGAKTCTAVGDVGILVWNGSRWSSQQGPTAVSLSGVSCTSNTACTAVGASGSGSESVVETRS
jgi:hypothetical protein